ncbi:cupin domain-containing protein [Larkinella insperata]|uniref:Cupin domain-containing protein n=1 Tax=Larkinella insperata TaxID=332158 RepID=A0ABW3Q600_9BACT
MRETITNPQLKETITFLQTAAQSGGKITELEITLLPGGGNPLHYHTTYSELFTALQGELGLQLKKGPTLFLKPGESYLVKKGEVHRFFNPGPQAITFRNEVRPGHEGFEQTLRILSGLAADGLYNDQGVPKSLTHLAICGILSDMRLPGLMRLTIPVIKLLAARARRSGVEQQLIDKYCR